MRETSRSYIAAHCALRIACCVLSVVADDCGRFEANFFTMTYELWFSKSENSFELTDQDARNASLRPADAELVTTFEAKSWQDALRMRDAYLGLDSARH
jgi:hypothetical protein